MSSFTPGPWTSKEVNGIGMGWKAGPAWLGEKSRSEECAANARLVAAAPAMDIALHLVSEGLARIERSGTLREFCFDGIRYSMNGDWNALIEVIGWDRVRGAIAKATGGAA